MKSELLLLSAVVIMLFSGSCDETPVQPLPEKPGNNVNISNSDEPDDPEDNPLEEISFGREITETIISRTEADRRGLYTVDKESERFMGPIIKPRRITVDMRAGTPASVMVNLDDAANLRWSKEYYSDYPCAIPGDTLFLSTGVWIYNPLAIDYGPVIARSVSPTQIQIIRKEEVSADQKPVEIALERSFIGMIPFELGVRATLVVELSDTPADSRDTDYSHYISMDQADAMGLFHMPFDSEEFRAPILEGGQKIVEFPEGESSITVELCSPAMPESNMVWHQGSTTIDGITYFDRDVKEWIFTPSKGQTPSLDFIMTDPLHITITRGEDFDFNYPNDMIILLGRGDYWNASDAGQTFAEICVVVK